jgi:hypothetical protein
MAADFNAISGGTEPNPALSCVPSLFRPHPNLSDQINGQIAQSEIEGGVFLQDLRPDTVLDIHTQHHTYRAVVLAENSVLISGHPEYCPEPVPVAVAGSTWGGAMLKRGFVGRGMHLEFCHPAYESPIVTSRIEEVREHPQPRRRDIRAGSRLQNLLLRAMGALIA